MEVQISAVIITFNEEKNIARCIESVIDLADEVLVVDSFSTDATQSICDSFGIRFIQHAFEGHIEQKNWAKDQAKFDYVLSLDADEALDQNLKQSILEVKNNWQYQAYSMNRLTNYCGTWIHHSGWYPDKKLRLFDRRKGEWGGSNPHDKYLPEKGSKVQHLKGDILHYSFYTTEEHLKQIHSFSSIGAKALYKRGKKSSYLKLVLKPIARFVKAFFLKRGFLDGSAGFAIARYSAYANYLKYKKLIKLQGGQAI